VLLSIASFPAADFDALFDGTRAVAWERFLPRHARVPVRGRSVRSALASVPACQSIVKKAIVERLKGAYGLRSLPEDGPTFEVEIALLKDEAMLVLDTTGPGLHKRGYRLESGIAPLKETLAAGLVLLSHWNRERPFLDPFCGTGTLAIEAALIGRNFAPGRERSFAAESWPSLAAGIWKRAREEARDRESPPLAEPLEASDRDATILALARRSAAKASVAGDVRFERRDVSALSSAREYGCLITNPPYAGRSGEEEEVRALYRAMPGMFRKLPTWSFFVLTARRDFETVFGQEADRRRKLYNGDVECTYFQFLGPRPGRGPKKPGEEEKPVFGGMRGSSRTACGSARTICGSGPRSARRTSTVSTIATSRKSRSLSIGTGMRSSSSPRRRASRAAPARRTKTGSISWHGRRPRPFPCRSRTSSSREGPASRKC
jgi:23S rRNA G2445 N2-methylase RlmL